MARCPPIVLLLVAGNICHVLPTDCKTLSWKWSGCKRPPDYESAVKRELSPEDP